MILARRLSAWWFAPVPAERLAAMRVLVGVFAVVYLASMVIPLWRLSEMPARSFAPVGILRVLDAPIASGVWRAIVLAAVPLAIAFTAGAAHRVLAPVFAAVLLVVTSYRNSWGMVFHTENLLVVHAIVLALAPAADAWSIDARRRASVVDGRHAWPLRTMAAATCLTYVMAGIAKLRLGGMAWLGGEELRDQVAIDNLRKLLLGSDVSSLATPLLEHPGWFAGLAVLTLVIELGAPVALVGGRVAAVWAAAAWGFHVGVIALMRIVFPYPLTGLAFAPLFALERPVQAVGRAIARWRSRRDR